MPKLILGLLVSMLSLASCAPADIIRDNTLVEEEREIIQAENVRGFGGGQAEGSITSIEFINNRAVPVCLIRVSASEKDGLDIVLAHVDDPILPDEARTMEVLVGKVIDVAILDCVGGVIELVERLEMPPSGVLWYLSPSTNRGAN